MDNNESPIEYFEELKSINKDTQEIDIAQILSCSERTIKSYVERGFLPEPIAIRNGIRYFLKDDVMDALGINDFDEVLV